MTLGAPLQARGCVSGLAVTRQQREPRRPAHPPTPGLSNLRGRRCWEDEPRRGDGTTLRTATVGRETGSCVTPGVR
jgi:hypothetical protein